jgi:hypothetical protein|tara:strand:+ start:520 stop:777 length:258 start_codon:yes stop_codon:yes gene_type:complete
MYSGTQQRMYKQTRKKVSKGKSSRMRIHREKKSFRFRRNPNHLFDLGSKEAMAYEPMTDEELTNEIKKYMKIRDDQYLEDSLGEI